MTIHRLSDDNRKKYSIMASMVAKGSDRIVEPFARFADFSIICCFKEFIGTVILNFMEQEYAALFSYIINDPYYLTGVYEELWSKQFQYENNDYYNKIIEEYHGSDTDRKAALLLFLLQKGNSDFIESKRTYGAYPKVLKDTIKHISLLLKGRCIITVKDNNVFKNARKDDIFFIDTYDDSLKEGIENILNNDASYVIYPGKQKLSSFERVIGDKGKKNEAYTGKSYFIFYT